MFESTLFAPDDTWVLWTFLVVWGALSIYWEQRYKWGARLSGPVIALIGGLGAANLGIIPVNSPVYDAVWDYVVPLCIPLLLLKADIRRIWKETGRMMGVYHISALGTVAGGFAAAFTVGFMIDHMPEAVGIMTASYIGGAMNFPGNGEVFRRAGIDNQRTDCGRQPGDGRAYHGHAGPAGYRLGGEDVRHAA